MTRKIKASNIATGAVTAAVLDNSGVTAGSYGSSTAIPVLTINAKGQVTVASTASLPSNLATETYVNTAVSNLVDAAPTALNTLNELAAALGDDANYAATITTALGTKADQSTTYTKTEVNTSLALKANSSSLGTLATVSPTGTANSSTFLRGDNSWQVVAVTPTAVSDQSNTSTGYLDLPSGTIAQRPESPNSGNTRFNTTANAVEVYTGTLWSLIGARDGSSYAAAATSATAIYDLGIRGKGLFWVQKADGSPVQTYCDLDTLGQDGKGGWMLVGSWGTASEWTKDSTSSSSVFGSTALNCFSSNFGNNNMTHMRVKVATSIDLASASSDADFYYYWSSPVQWKTVWAAGAGVNTHYNSSTVNNGASTPRNSLRQFSYAYNLKFGYTANTQVWANISDSGVTGSTGTEEWRDWYSGLTTPGITLGANMRGDGTFAITFGGDTSTGAGQDCNNANAKYGYDDTTLCAWGGTSGTNNIGANTGTQGNNTNLWMWIK